MKHSLLSIILYASAAGLLACENDTGRASADPVAPAVSAPHDAVHGGMGAGAPGASTTGKVVETMSSGGYTYVLVDDGSRKIWAAAPEFQVAVGDQVVVPAGVPMQNFESKTLGRSFDLVYFASGIQVSGKDSAAQPAAPEHGASMSRSSAPEIEVSNLEKAEGGYTVAELFAERAALTGQEVAVRGKVAKFTSGVMGKNWVHLQDGTGETGTNDVTVTTTGSASVGSTVLVRGKLATNRDFGFGYHYDVIIEDASVAVE